MDRETLLRRRVRVFLGIFMVGLVLSGLTAFPLATELRWLTGVLGVPPDGQPEEYSGALRWLVTVRDALQRTGAEYPFLAYGTDWLAFAHLVIAVAFIGPMRDPVRNVWVITFGLIACAGVIPLALIVGSTRGIPMPWRLLDCSFGVLGAIPLYFARRTIRELSRLAPESIPRATR
ncbi:MAG: hypothetical protein L0170_20405 [Acidobacteria bacterium]|nr:hypothetical protein [Acidobacteriota bacterium]